MNVRTTGCNTMALNKKGGEHVKKGYFTPDGYMGLVNGQYKLFASESDYLDYLE